MRTDNLEFFCRAFHASAASALKTGACTRNEKDEGCCSWCAQSEAACAARGFQAAGQPETGQLGRRARARASMRDPHAHELARPACADSCITRTRLHDSHAPRLRMRAGSACVQAPHACWLRMRAAARVAATTTRACPAYVERPGGRSHRALLVPDYSLCPGGSVLREIYAAEAARPRALLPSLSKRRNRPERDRISGYGANYPGWRFAATGALRGRPAARMCSKMIEVSRCRTSSCTEIPSRITPRRCRRSRLATRTMRSCEPPTW